MNDLEFRAFLSLMMCSDPWPTGDESENNVLIELAVKESVKRGFDSWIVAYHEFKLNG